MNRRIIIVGPSGSGKTTIGQALARELKLPLISMDDFRCKMTHGCAPKVLHGKENIRTYEDPACWDGNAISCKLRALAPTGFVAEGNHLLMYPQIAAIENTERYYIDVPFSVSVERRKTRHRYLPADVSFNLIGKQETDRVVAPQLTMRGVIRLDGLLSTYALGTEIFHQQFESTRPLAAR